jgi:predicted metallopeptidase
MKLPFYLNEVLTGRFRRVLLTVVALILLIALVLIARTFSGHIRSIGHSYHQADDLSNEAM